MSTAAKSLRTVLKGLAEQAPEAARTAGMSLLATPIQPVEADPRIVNAESKFHLVVLLMDEANGLNEVAAADKRREAARLARSTAINVLSILAA